MKFELKKINFKKLFSENKKRFYLCCIFFLILIFLLIKSFAYPKNYIVYVENQALYEELSSYQKFSKMKKFKLISSPQKMKFIGSVPIILANISLEKDFNLNPEEKMPNQVFYKIEENVFYPSVESDFSLPSSKVKNVLSPDFSISISSLDNIPEKNRAVKIDGLYGSDEKYPLVENVYLACTFFNKKYQSKIEDFLNSYFTYENRKFSLVDSSERKTLFVASVGDIMVARGIQESLIYNEKGLEKVFSDTLPILQSNDITIGNLEGVVTNSSKNAIKTYTFKFNHKVLDPLKKAGFNYFMITNNHCYDYGEAGFKDTLKALSDYGIPFSGAGLNKKEAEKFYTVEKKNQKVSIISCGAYPVERSGFNGKKTATATETRAGILWESDELVESVKLEKEKGNLVVVNVHGGEEYVFHPNKSQRSFYEKLIDAGASVVFGSHPHVLQATEWYKNGLIVYSQGNFIFPGMEGMNGATESEILRLGFVKGKLAYVEQYPCKLSFTGVKLK